MTEFLIFVAPFVVLIGTIILAFWVAPMNGPAEK
ncbi:cytochrome bd oxidase small subunit CydS [Paenisporosarcina cavernae]